jgi:hypothetical protein
VAEFSRLRNFSVRSFDSGHHVARVHDERRPLRKLLSISPCRAHVAGSMPGLLAEEKQFPAGKTSCSRPVQDIRLNRFSQKQLDRAGSMRDT